MRLYLYYDEDLITSAISQLQIPEFDIDFFSVSVEKQKNEDYSFNVEPQNNKCKLELISNYSKGSKVEYIYANIEFIKNIRKNKFIYNVLEKIEENIKDLEDIHFEQKEIDKELNYMCDSDKYLVSEKDFKAYNCSRIVTLGYKINDKCIKPICIYLNY